MNRLRPNAAGMRARRSELLTEVADTVAGALVSVGVGADPAALCGGHVADRLANHWGGSVLSFPRDSAYRLRQREAEALVMFDGSNYAELARRFGMGERGLRKLIKRAIERRREESAS